METLANLGTSKSLEDLLGPILLTQDESKLAETAFSIYGKPIKEFSIEDLRFMIAQELGLEILIPIAAELLKENLLLEGDYYPGDLLSAVTQVPSAFWKEHSDLYWKVAEIVGGLPPVLRQLERVIGQFEQLGHDDRGVHR